MPQKDPLHSFANLPREIDTALRKSLRVRNYTHWETIFLQGDSPRATYLVASGRVKIARVTKEGHESILCVRGPGDYLCPVPLLDKGDHLGTALAMTDVTLFWIEREEFLSLCRQSPHLLSMVQGDCLAEVRHLLNRLESFAFRNVRERVAIALLNEAHRQVDSTHSPNVITMTQQELAGLVGASRESVSRSLKKLESAGIIKLKRGKMIIQNPQRLEKIAS